MPGSKLDRKPLDDQRFPNRAQGVAASWELRKPHPSSQISQHVSVCEYTIWRLVFMEVSDCGEVSGTS